MPFLLAECARSERARLMRAVKASLATASVRKRATRRGDARQPAWSLCSQSPHDEREAGHPRRSCAPGTEEGMEPDDVLYSRNARPQKALGERSQWKLNQLPSLKRKPASLEGSSGVLFDERTGNNTSAISAAAPTSIGEGEQQARGGPTEYSRRKLAYKMIRPSRC